MKEKFYIAPTCPPNDTSGCIDHGLQFNYGLGDCWFQCAAELDPEFFPGRCQLIGLCRGVRLYLWQHSHFFAHQVNRMRDQGSLFFDLVEPLEHLRRRINNNASVIKHECGPALEARENRADELAEVFAERDGISAQKFQCCPALLECEARIDGSTDSLHEAQVR